MFKVDKKVTIDRDPHQYLSFPDIIKSPVTEGKMFLVYRAGDSHHPVWSKLVLWASNDNGGTWDPIGDIDSSAHVDGFVWNCPRLAYIDQDLYITCDLKSGTRERVATFKTTHVVSKNEGKSFKQYPTTMPGMVPDTIIKFKNRLFCANHKIKSPRNDLIQLVSWSRDNGKTWWDTNIVAHDERHQYCEASIANMGEYLIAYLRDNSGHKRHVYTVTSEDGIHWTKPQQLPIFGQRVTALKDEDRDGYVVGAYRNTNVPTGFSFNNKLEVTAFEHNIGNGKMKLSKIDWEHPENQYHFGYTGMVRTAPNKYIIAYYVKQKSINPYIKLAHVTKVK